MFTSTQRDADWLADRLADMGHAVASLHGGMPQGRRNRVLQGLRTRQLRVLVATDVAARGIDVPTISHVINYGLPMKAEDYVHRIGRTGRAGRNGLAVTLAERMDSGMIRRIQQFTTQNIPVATIAGLEPKSPEPRMPRGPRRARVQAGPRARQGLRQEAVRAARRRLRGARAVRSVAPRSAGTSRRPSRRGAAQSVRPRARCRAASTPSRRASRPAAEAAPARKGGFKPARPRTGGFGR